MITNEQIRQCVNDCSKAGHKIGMRDISYVLLSHQYEDKATAYRVLFGLDADFNADYVYTYDLTGDMVYLREYVERNLIVDISGKKKKKNAKYVGSADISFEENKAEIINLIKETQKALEDGTIEAKDALKIQADLRVKLNDKFAVTEDARDQIVIVQQKFNSVCQCGREVARRPITKEEAMEMYDLVEKETENNNSEYDL